MQCFTFIYLYKLLDTFEIIISYTDVSVKFAVPCQRY